MIKTVTFDIDALLALERRRQRLIEIARLIRGVGGRLMVPQVVLSDWWRGRTDARERILAWVHVEPFSDGIAKLAGEAIAAVQGATTVDAIVMASTAQRGDTVYTSDPDDLERLRDFFPAVRVLGV